MFRAIFAAIFVTAVLLMGSILVIPVTNGTHDYVNFAKAVPLRNGTNTNNSGRANFTVYVPDSQFDISIAQSAMNYIGINPQKSGMLWTFSVPDYLAHKVNYTLHKMTRNSGITSFFSTTQTVVKPSITYSYTGQNLNIPFAYTPNIISRAYNFTWALSHGINGSGITIGIIDAYGNPNIRYDLKAFDAVNGLPNPNLTIVYPISRPGSYNSTWAMETSTDVEWAHALAPEAKIVLLVANSAYTSDLQDVVSYAVSNHVANVLSLSWGTPESSLPINSELTYSNVYSQAASIGMTILAASGDYGAYSGGSTLTVDFPASDPYVTGVGGTSLYSFNSEFHQSGWGGIVNGQSYGSGGGFSSLFGTPYWQSVKGYDNTMRGVPDVALDANKYTGVYVISSGGQYIVGGTSVSTPIWADVVALIEQHTGVHLSSINPLLYQIARTNLYNSSFTQILTGTNGYYSNTPYWNPVTGLGTPKVSMLINVSKEVLDGYGGVAVFNGSRSYNATGISADLNVTPQQGRMENNGTTFYYDGFFFNPSNYVKFGVTVNTTGEALRLIISQGGQSITSSYNMPPGYGGKLTLFKIGASFDASSVSVWTSGGFTKTIPVFLNFSGEMSPSVGTSQIETQTNLTVINPGNFSSVLVTNGTGWIRPSYIFFQHYSGIEPGTYPTIDASENNGQLQFFSSTESTPGSIGTLTSPGVELLYHQSYSYPTELRFYLHGTDSSVQWNVNSIPLGTDIYYAQNGGVYIVNATFTNSNQLTETITRNITVPDMHHANVSVNYTIKGKSYPGTEITSMWFYKYQYQTPDMQIPAMNSTTVANAVATGFYGVSSTFTGDSNITFRLTPIDIGVSLFVFNSNATVTFDNHTVNRIGGFYYGSVSPGRELTINVSKNGYVNQTQTLLIEPGKNISLQVDLTPVNSGSRTLTGTVSDYIFSFPIENALVKIGQNLASYTNSTGVFFLYPVAGKYNISASADMYQNFSTPLNISSSTVLNIKMIPARISVNSHESLSITHFFPLLFYFGYISWTPYKGQNFSMYQIYVSTNKNFLNPKVTTVASPGTGFTFLSGLAPGSTYYISVVLRLSNSQVYQSQVVKITYTDPVFLGVNLVIFGAIGFYIYMGYRVFRKKRDSGGIQ